MPADAAGEAMTAQPRRFGRGPGVATMMDVITPEALTVEGGGLVVHIGLPPLFG